MDTGFRIGTPRKVHCIIERANTHKHGYFDRLERQIVFAPTGESRSENPSLNHKFRFNTPRVTLFFASGNAQAEELGRLVVDRNGIGKRAGPVKHARGIGRPHSPQHLPRYLAEFEHRHNCRKMTDGERTDVGLTKAAGKRLIYRK